MIKILFAKFFVWYVVSGMCCQKRQEEIIQAPILKQSSGGVFEQLRRFNTRVNLFKIIDNISKNFRNKSEKQEIERKRLEEDVRRRKIFEKYLLVYQQGSSVLRDFQTSRF